MRALYNHPSSRQVLRFLATGALGVSINLASFTVLLQVLHAEYVLASVLALSLSTVVGFILQKYWTFRSEKLDQLDTKEILQEETMRQFAIYTGVAIVNLGLDAVVVYTMVHLLLLNEYVAQATAAAIVALWSFFIYKNILFVSRES